MRKQHDLMYHKEKVILLVYQDEREPELPNPITYPLCG